MRKRDIQNRIRILYQQLHLINRYPEGFLKSLGKKGLEKFTDTILDEINKLRILLNDLED